MATTQDSNDSTKIWLNAQTAQRQALLVPPPTSKGDSFLSRQSTASVLLRDQYTDLTASLNCTKSEKLIENDKDRRGLDDAIAKALALDDAPLERRVVVLAGPTGVGKSVYMEKLAQDWAKAKVLQSYGLLLRVCVSECMVAWACKVRESGSVDERDEMERGCLSLEKLLLLAHPHLSSETLSHILREQQSSSSPTEHRLLLLLDGLDQTPHLSSITELLVPPSEEELSRLCSDPRRPVPIHDLLCCLAHRALLPGASLVITSRCVPELDILPAGAKVVEVLGFSPSQRSQFFQNFLGSSTGRELTQLCERAFGPYEFSGMPLFCWTLASAARALQQAGGGAALPETLTQLYTHITALILRPSTTSSEAGAAEQMPPARTLLRGLSQLARDCFLKDEGFHTQEDLQLYGLEPFLSSPQLRVFLHECFDHSFAFLCPLMKQFLVAISFFLEGCGWDEGTEEMMVELNEVLKEPNPAEEVWAVLAGTFVAGLSEASQQTPLEGLLEASYTEAQAAEFKRWLETHARESLESFSKERHLHCFHLLRETQNPALVLHSISSPNTRFGISYSGLGRADCAALGYVLSCAVQELHLNLYNSQNLTSGHTSVLLPAFKRAQKIMLSQSVLPMECMAHLAEGLRGGVATELDLSYCHLGDEKLRVLCPGLAQSPLHTLLVPVNDLTAVVCKDLSAALAACELRVLDIRGNSLTDEGLVLLCKALKSPQCKLQELSLHSCDLTGGCMDALSEALSCGHCPLTSLDLTRNEVQDHGMISLARGLSNPGCKIRTLNLTECYLTHSCCAALAAVIRSGGSLTELHLTCNDLGQEGALTLCESLKSPACSLTSLSMTRCELTLPVFGALEEVLCGGSKLQALALGLHEVGDQGARHMWKALKHPCCRLKDLDLEMIGLTDDCVADLCEAVRARGSLNTLILKNNNLTDDSVPSLVQLAKDCPRLKELNLQYNDLSEDYFELMESCSRIRY